MAAAGNTPIDIHAHFIPDEYRQVLADAGIDSVDGYPLPSWDRDAAVDLMERRGLAAQIVSVSAPGIDAVPLAKRAGLSRTVNERAAELKAWRPDRFGAFAMLPLPDMDATLREIEFIYDELQLDGINLYTNVQGVYPGDPQLDPLFEELNRRKSTIFFHPVAPQVFGQLDMGVPAPTIEYPFETTRAVVKMAGSGLLDRFPDMKIILPHGGGTLPFLALRTSLHLARFGSGLHGKTADHVLGLYRRFYYDLTAVSHAWAIDALLALAPPERLLYGSDHPFMPESVADTAFEFLRNKSAADGRSLLQWAIDNGDELFPRFAKAATG